MLVTRCDGRVFTSEKQSITSPEVHAASCDLVNHCLDTPECMEKEDEIILLLHTNLPCIWVACSMQGVVVFKICAGCRLSLLDTATI